MLWTLFGSECKIVNKLKENEVQNMSNEEDKIAKFKIKPQSPCKRFKGKKLGKDEYWSPNLVMSNKIETMDIDLCDKELSNWKDGMSN